MSALPSDDLAARIRGILDAILEEYRRAPLARPWVIGFSGGKDSTLVVLAVGLLKVLG